MYLFFIFFLQYIFGLVKTVNLSWKGMREVLFVRLFSMRKCMGLNNDKGEKPAYFWDAFSNLLPLMDKFGNKVEIEESAVKIFRGCV